MEIKSSVHAWDKMDEGRNQENFLEEIFLQNYCAVAGKLAKIALRRIIQAGLVLSLQIDM